MEAAVRPALMVGCWLAWVMPFAVRRNREKHEGAKIDARARWGIMLAMAGFAAVNMHSPRLWNSQLAAWRAVAAIAVTLIAAAVAWSAVTNLGRQWRIDAGLNPDHELVQTGAYRYVRHPIYASMIGMLLMCVFLTGTWPGWLIGVVLFFAGTEIRVRVEDNLLRERFGDRFVEWQRRVPAYLPFVR